MIYSSNNQYNNIDSTIIGGKAFNLLQLIQQGFNIPPFIVLPHKLLGNKEELKRLLQSQLNSLNLDNNFAVRSSANCEDSKTTSYAGQFKTLLNVRKEHLLEAVYDVFNSDQSAHIQSYQHNLGKSEIHISVIIQEMIPSEVSGVGFGMHPVSQDPNLKVINAVYGIGEGLVSGQLNADEYTISPTEITKYVVNKNTKFELSGAEIAVEPSLQNLSALSDAQITQVTALIDRCNNYFGCPQDIEFAFSNGQLYLLQSRPITKVDLDLDRKSTHKIVWDNSNIIESYPGVTTPLTFTFISRSYELAYRNFATYLGVDKKAIEKHANIYKNTLGLINGRVYYNLRTWYQMLAMLPGYSINAKYMETMMGVKESFDIESNLVLSKNEARFKLFKTAIKMLYRHFTIHKERNKFSKEVDATITEYKAIEYQILSINELVVLYREFEDKLLDKWKAPLLNDLFAMIWFGILKKEITKIAGNTDVNLHNDLLCGSSDIISTQPIHRTAIIAAKVKSNSKFTNLFLEPDEEFIWHLLQTDDQYQELKYMIDQYIQEFGERCVGELKLETKSYSSNPSKLIKLIKSYVQINTDSISTSKDKEIRAKAEEAYDQLLKRKPIKKRWLNYVLRKTRDLVSGRENLRFKRSQAFGIVRELFTQIGIKLAEMNLINEADDIFYLTREEVISYSEGRSVSQDLKMLIHVRKTEFAAYTSLPQHKERIISHGILYHNTDFYTTTSTGPKVMSMKGIGCSPGVVKGKVQVIHSPEEVTSLDGDILVTHSTDPGWVVLFPSAAAIIVERGSLLSHSAIVSREMGKPCIVGVTGLMSNLKTGDYIEMDGRKGTITLLKRQEIHKTIKPK